MAVMNDAVMHIGHLASERVLGFPELNYEYGIWYSSRAQ